MSEDYEKQNEAISEVISNLRKERDELENGIDTENPFLVTFRKYENIDKLTREILIELVDVIKVYEGGDISIRFKFADDLLRITEYTQVNSHLQVGYDLRGFIECRRSTIQFTNLIPVKSFGYVTVITP